MTTEEQDKMRRACKAYYGVKFSFRNLETTEYLLQAVAKKTGWHVTVQIFGQGEYPFTVYVNDLTDTINAAQNGATLAEAALRCAYEAIPEESR